MTQRRRGEDVRAMGARDDQLYAESERLYEQYGKPLEPEHWGDFVAIAPDGRTLLAPTLAQAMQHAADAFGPGNFIFKVGERAVGKRR